MLFDTHAHLDFPELSEDLEGVLERAAAVGVQEIMTIGIDLKSSRRAAELAHTHPRIYASAGIHPHGAQKLDRETLSTLRALAARERVLAIGEIGLDYYRDRQPRPVQQECMRQQIELAIDLKLPVVFHIRDAHEDFLHIVREYTSELTGAILHCFSADWDIAVQCLELGFYLSIPGTVTFPKSEAQQEVVRRAPAERLILETDAPYLAPVPYRGKVNEPSYVFHTARKVAELREVRFEEIARQTTLNAHEVLGIGAIPKDPSKE